MTHWSCSVCNQPMVEGQAFNGLKRSHWDCSPHPVYAEPARRPLREEPEHVDVESSAPSVNDRPPARLSEPGPTSADVRKAAMDPEARQIETRRWVEVSRNAINGRTSIGLECPFCYAVVKAYVWSLPNGKRCPCGAYHGRLLSTHWSQGTPTS